MSVKGVHMFCIKCASGLATLQKEFPFGVKRADGTLRLFWCTEKPHSVHGALAGASTDSDDQHAVTKCSFLMDAH